MGRRVNRQELKSRMKKPYLTVKMSAQEFKAASLSMTSDWEQQPPTLRADGFKRQAWIISKIPPQLKKFREELEDELDDHESKRFSRGFSHAPEKLLPRADDELLDKIGNRIARFGERSNETNTEKTPGRHAARRGPCRLQFLS